MSKVTNMKLRNIAAVVALASIVGNAQAELFDRGGGLIYDDVLKVTWLQDANLAATNSFGVSGIRPNGSMSLDTAQSWIAAMNTADYLGYDNWRLPSIAPINGNAFNYDQTTVGNTDYGYNISAVGTIYAGSTANEMAFMYFNNLGNQGYYTATGDVTGCATGLSSTCLNNVDQFDNLESSRYWVGTVYAPSNDHGWAFHFYDGGQSADDKHDFNIAWAVRDGDVAAPVPEPETYAMMLAGLGLLGLTARRRRQKLNA